ncbi:MAG TPA: monofunctional biosynthetic peptidoglycan transglycosylase [Casimicrobiaceae bacterium]|nr:monofunctional biosynthetic peptidoglycan transglycosylase [Casimicrobiaceae bacterium]
MSVRRVVVLVAWVALAALVALHAYYATMIWWWRDHAPRETAFMSERLAALRIRNPHATIEYRFVPYTRISVELKRAMIAAEDAKFVEHEGFDWDGIALALEKNERRGRIVAGGSTISQQLAKNLFLSGSRTWLRKGEEAVITVMLESILDKRRIFELYLNVIEFGNGIFGAEAASEHYFHVPASRIDAVEAARLAAMAPNPRYYERHPNAPGLRRKIGIILARMPAADLP